MPHRDFTISSHPHAGAPQPEELLIELFMHIASAVISAEADGEGEIIVRNEDIDEALVKVARFLLRIDFRGTHLGESITSIAQRIVHQSGPHGIIREEALRAYEEGLRRMQANMRVVGDQFKETTYTMQHFMDMFRDKEG